MLDRRNERRRDERLLVRLAVGLVRGKGRLPLFTEDVSFRGLFLLADKPPAVHQLIQLEISLPASDRILAVHARVVRARLPGDASGLAPGVGVELHALAGEAKTTWEDFVRGLLPKGRPSTASMHATGRLERPGKELCLLVESIAELRALLVANGEEGATLVATTLALPIGHGFRVTVVHPRTAATHALDCVVRWRDTESTSPGVGVEFERLSEQQRTAFRDFIGDEFPHLSATMDDVDQAQVEEWEEEEPTNVRPLPQK